MHSWSIFFGERKSSINRAGHGKTPGVRGPGRSTKVTGPARGPRPRPATGATLFIIAMCIGDNGYTRATVGFRFPTVGYISNSPEVDIAPVMCFSLCIGYSGYTLATVGYWLAAVGYNGKSSHALTSDLVFYSDMFGVSTHSHCNHCSHVVLPSRSAIYAQCSAVVKACEFSAYGSG